MTRKEILEKTIDFDDAIHRIIRLEEENAKLKSECTRCVHTDCLCVPSDFGKNRIGICVNFKDVFEKNAELEEELNYSKTHCLFHSDCPTQKELASIKLKVAALEGEIPWKDIKDKSEVIGKLSKAKELIKTLLLIADNKVSQMEFLLCVAEAKRFLRNN